MSSISLVNSITNSNGGYRQRLYEKLLKNRLDGFQDYKVIELLLTLGTPRTDCKQQAKAVLKKN
jgi:DNA repair protein RadC